MKYLSDLPTGVSALLTPVAVGVSGLSGLSGLSGVFRT